ncbi:TPA: Na/Pi cotransporter family protein [Escherichia coli]|nr:Na/Pi cotransporter family protein [Escherichia coli]
METILTLVSAVALLIWGAKNVQKGVVRAFGETLRRLLSKSVSNRHKAFIGGALTTCLTQSSNATILMTNSFAAQGLITLEGAMAIALGADAGSALMAKILTLDLSWVGPFLLIVGVWIINKNGKGRQADIGLAITGLGLMLLALRMIITTAEPIFQATLAKELLMAMTADVGLNVLMGAGLAMLSYSSLAATLLTATLASTGAIPLTSALEIAIGTTIGSGVLAMINGNSAGGVSKQSAIGSFLFKLIGGMIVLPFTGVIAREALKLNMSPLEIVVNFHLAWNFLRTIIQVYLISLMSKLMRKLIPDIEKEEDPGKAKYLSNEMDSPSLALTNAARETVRMGDFVHEMVKGMPVLFSDTANYVHADNLKTIDRTIDRLYNQINKYLITLSGLEGNDSYRWTQIMQWSMNLEQIGDILSVIIKKIKTEKIDKKVYFSDVGKNELNQIWNEIETSMNIAMALFLEPNSKTVVKLKNQKELIRNLEEKYSQEHLKRLQRGTTPSLETSSLHMDLLNEFKRLNSLICSMAFQIDPAKESDSVFSRDDREEIKTAKKTNTDEEMTDNDTKQNEKKEELLE